MLLTGPPILEDALDLALTPDTPGEGPLPLPPIEDSLSHLSNSSLTSLSICSLFSSSLPASL